MYTPTDSIDNIDSNFIFRNAVEFSEYIELISSRLEVSLTQAIIDYCEMRDADYEDINKLITPTLKGKIAFEMQELGLLANTNTLDFD